MTRTTIEPDPDDDYQPSRKFNRFYNRTGNEVLRSLKIPVDILDRLELFKQQNNLDQEQIAAAAESGSEIAAEVNEELTHVKLLAMEGLIVQQGISSLSKTQAEVEQQQKVFDRNRQLVKRNQELEAYVKNLVIPLTWIQLKSALPYLGIATLCLAAVIIFNQANGRNTNPSTPANSPTVQPEVLPSPQPSSGG
jgi:hypothetical protein